MTLSWQGSLFDGASPAEPLSFDRVTRHRLDERSWLDEVTGWLPDHGAVFDLLLSDAPWRQRERRMYDRTVLEPRMVAGWSGLSLPDLPPRLEQLRSALSAHYRVDFDSVLVNLYRDGRDGVAWHGDTVRKTLRDPLVATVSLGERRRFLLRPGSSGPATRTFTPGGGDLLVMGGACQHLWQHTVPKAARAGARMSITLRHSAEAGGPASRAPAAGGAAGADRTDGPVVRTASEGRRLATLTDPVHRVDRESKLQSESAYTQLDFSPAWSVARNAYEVTVAGLMPWSASSVQKNTPCTLGPEFAMEW